MKYEVPILEIVCIQTENMIYTSLGNNGKTEDLPDMFV